jgi:hypothetical protein
MSVRAALRPMLTAFALLAPALMASADEPRPFRAQTMDQDLTRVQQDVCELEKIRIAKLPEVVAAYGRICADKDRRPETWVQAADVEGLPEGLTADCRNEGRKIGACLARLKTELEKIETRAQTCVNCRSEMQAQTAARKHVSADLESVMGIAGESCSLREKQSMDAQLVGGVQQEVLCALWKLPGGIWDGLKSQAGRKPGAASQAGVCKADEPSCISNLLIQTLKGITDLKGLWDIATTVGALALNGVQEGAKAAGRRIAAYWHGGDHMDDAASTAARNLSAQSEASVRQFSRDKEGWLKSFIREQMKELNQWIAEDIGCQKWSGDRWDKSSRCLTPAEPPGCRPWRQSLQIVCGVIGRVWGAGELGGTIAKPIGSFAYGTWRGFRASFRGWRAGEEGVQAASQYLASTMPKATARAIAEAGADRAAAGAARVGNETAESAAQAFRNTDPKLRDGLIELSRRESGQAIERATPAAGARAASVVPQRVVVRLREGYDSVVKAYRRAVDEAGISGVWLMGGESGRASARLARGARGLVAEAGERGASVSEHGVQAEVSQAIELRVEMSRAQRLPGEDEFAFAKRLREQSRVRAEARASSTVDEFAGDRSTASYEAPPQCGPGQRPIRVIRGD